MDPKNNIVKRFQRVTTWSKCYLKLAYSAGTKQPHIAITVSRPICRKYVLFPEKDIRCILNLTFRNSLRTRHALLEDDLKIKQRIEGLESRLTLVLVQFEKMKIRSSKHRWEPKCPQTARFRAQDGDRISRPECQ